MHTLSCALSLSLSLTVDQFCYFFLYSHRRNPNELLSCELHACDVREKRKSKIVFETSCNRTTTTVKHIQAHIDYAASDKSTAHSHIPFLKCMNRFIYAVCDGFRFCTSFSLEPFPFQAIHLKCLFYVSVCVFYWSKMQARLSVRCVPAISSRVRRARIRVRYVHHFNTVSWIFLSRAERERKCFSS